MASLCNNTKEKILSKNVMKNMAWKLIASPFEFSKSFFLVSQKLSFKLT